MADPFASKRLIYRSIDPKTDLPFFLALASDPAAEMAVNPNLPKPVDKAGIEKFMSRMAEVGSKFNQLCLLVCLPAPIDPSTSASTAAAAISAASDSGAAAAAVQPTPIGMVNLVDNNGGNMPQLRRLMLGINVLKQYRGQGYGSEAIEWALHWGFVRAGLHSIRLGYFGWNAEAGKLYKKLGFVEDARFRDYLWHEGKFWECIEMSMLEDEWRASRGIA